MTQWCNDKAKGAEKRWSSNASLCQISSDAYGKIPRRLSLYIVCRILGWLFIDNSVHIFRKKLVHRRVIIHNRSTSGPYKCKSYWTAASFSL